MIWSPSIAKKLDEAVPPFENTPRDWSDVLARSNERTAKILHGRRKLLLGLAVTTVIATMLSLIVTLPSDHSSAAEAQSPPEIWAAIAASPSFAGNPAILGIRGDFSAVGGDPYGRLTVTVAMRASGARDRLVDMQHANWIALTAAAMYENEALQAGRSGLRAIVPRSRVESKEASGTVYLSLESGAISVSGDERPAVAPADLASAKARVLAKGASLPGVTSLKISLLDFGNSAAAEIRVVTSDGDAFYSTFAALSKLLNEQLAGALIGTELEVYDSAGSLVVYRSGSSLLDTGAVWGSRPWAMSLTAAGPLMGPAPSAR